MYNAAMFSDDTTIGFIGAGNMAGALIEGLLARGFPAARLCAADSDPARLAPLSARGITTTTDNARLVSANTIVVLAVKPQVMAQVLQPLQSVLAGNDCLLVSVAAGIPVASLQAWTHPRQAIVRCMPNTPALVGAGATALYANAHCSDAQRDTAFAILGAVGQACWLDTEAHLDAVTALSGSGPAYFFLLMEAMQSAGERLGLPPDTARELCLQTALGAARLALASDVDVAELRRRVTSPGGTTEAALRQFGDEDFSGIVLRALTRAAERSRELAAASTPTTTRQSP